MKKQSISNYIVILSILFTFLGNINAQTVSLETAKAKAMAFLSNGANKMPAKNGMKRQAPKVQNIQLAYTSQKEGRTCFYVFNNGEDGGFVIIGGDEAAKEVLAYVPQGHFDYEKAPDNFKWWLGEYEKEIMFSKKMNAPSKKVPSAMHKIGQVTTSVRDLFADIPDLISTKWDQLDPYNAKIPAIHHTNGDSIVSPTGCVPTAFAQIMNYWKWPITGEGSYSYTLDYGTLDEWSAGANPGDYDGLLPATFSADFGNTTFDWENMLDDYTVGSPTQTQIDAVSTLMYHVGVAGHTLYGPGGSGGGNVRTMTALKNYFKYCDRFSYLERGDYLEDEWEEIIYSELLSGRPVCYDNNLHAFIIHGYSANLGMYSVNWGWGGFMDGYFKISATDYPYFVDNENITMDYETHGICIHIEPNNVVHTNSFENVGDTIVVDGIRYDLIGPISKTVEVTYAPNNEIIYDGELSIPESIVYNNEVYTVTKIGRYGLASACSVFDGISWGGTTSIQNLRLPNTLRSIAQGGLCASGIQELRLPDCVEMIGENCFGSMTSLEKAELSNNLTYIPNYCFWQCHKLESISLPASIKAVGFMSFNDCQSLDVLVSNAIEVPTSTLDEILGYSIVFSSDVKNKILAVPQESIDAYRNDPVFGLWGSIVPIESLPLHFGERLIVDNIAYRIMASGNEVYTAGFEGEYIDTLVIPSTIKYDGVTYSVRKIGYGAFEHKNVNHLIVEEGVHEIGESSFKDCSIVSVHLPNTIKKIGPCAFANCQFLLNVNLQNGLETIGEGAFSGCWQMKSFFMPNSVKEMGSMVFAWCDSLRNIKLSSSLSNIGYDSFARTNLETIILPDGITKIRDCFRWCNSLQGMICYAPNVPLLEGFDGGPTFPSYISQKTLYVPEESVDSYKSTPGWQDWGTILPLILVESLNLNDLSMEKLKTAKISVQVLPTNATPGQVFYSSSNPKVATVSFDGVITALEDGQTVITAETLNGKTATCIVTVTVAGDTNGDGKVDASDVPALSNTILGKSTDTTGVGDINGDGVVNIVDIAILISRLVQQQEQNRW